MHKNEVLIQELSAKINKSIFFCEVIYIYKRNTLKLDFYAVKYMRTTELPNTLVNWWKNKWTCFFVDSKYNKIGVTDRKAG